MCDRNYVYYSLFDVFILFRIVLTEKDESIKAAEDDFYHKVIEAKYAEADAQRCIKKMFLEISQNSQENTCARVSFLIKLPAEACNLIKKETLAQLFSSEF